MDNAGFELQEDGVQRTYPNKRLQTIYHEYKHEEKKSCSLMRIFLVCFLACLITTAIGVLILCLVYLGYIGPGTSQMVMIPTGPGMGKPPQSTNNSTTGGATEPRFNFMSQLTKSKVFTFEGGAIQWARYRNNPKDYANEKEMQFGASINQHRSKMTLGTLRILSKGLRAPHWHFNANEHGFLLQGKAWIGVVDDGGVEVTTYNVTAGQVIFFPKNTLHWVKNVGDEDCLFVLFFTTHDELSTLDVDDAFYLTPEDIAARSLKPVGGVNFIRTFHKPKEDQAINLPKNLVELIQNASYVQSNDSKVWQYFYDLKGSREFVFPGGIIQWARYRKNGAGLNDTEKIYGESINSHADTLTLGTLRIKSNGLRQPHFHFNAHEMGYVISGCGQIGIIGDKPVPDFTVGIGDVFFFPIGTQHYIKSTCDEDLLMILAFSTGNQLETLDMDDYFHATSDHILAQLFLKKQSEFKKIPKFKEDQAVNLP
ncbi:dynactin-associated protein [Anomaloglossus baeobatrachus]|uniref:dynactin-associated protein n=1 Tax=Anomaloglossus baeobatrachus TaxID=238106 RepID=UPI003F502493